MKVSIVTAFPSLYTHFLETSLIKRARQNGFVKFDLIEFSSVCQPGKRIDEPTVGPGPGMILKPDVVEQAIEKCIKKHGSGITIFFSPQGQKLTQPLLRLMAHKFIGTKPTENNKAHTSNDRAQKPETHLILVCARYEGIDARVEDELADIILSIGDYVLMGGDLPAQVLLEGIMRLMPGVLGNEESTITESFESPFLDHPEYGLPTIWNEKKIPEIVQSGNHKAIYDWRKQKAAKNTMLKRFDWFRSNNPSNKEIHLAQENIPPHYLVLMHNQVTVGNSNVGTTSVTSLDLHDIARSCATYNIKNFFVVTHLLDQQAIVKEFQQFWTSDRGRAYNPSRFEAISRLVLCASLDDVIEKIEANDGAKPILITTSAKTIQHSSNICYQDQELVWNLQKPVLIVLGTGQGLNDDMINKSDFLLLPIEGMSDYNHLSVRCAAGIILDRWLGLQPKTERIKGKSKNRC